MTPHATLPPLARLRPWLAGAMLFLGSTSALAHVKWFSQNAKLQDTPLSLAEIANPTFFGLAALSLVVVVALALLDDPLQRSSLYLRLRDALVAHEHRGANILRLATGMSLLLSWQANVLLAPDLGHDSALVSWAQFIAILCLLDRRSTPAAGAIVWLLYAVGIYRHGIFHMLDYAAFVGVGFYLLFHGSKREQLEALVKPVLFGTTGLSLAWLALEKLVFPTWGLAILEQNPILSLGLPAPFFLQAAAFVEFALGYLLLLGVLGRPLAMIITVVFFLTTMVFGKDEVVGHLILHGILIVFMLEGTRGPLAPPFRFHQSRPLRVAFVGVNFALLLGITLFGYQRLADPRFVVPIASRIASPPIAADHDAGATREMGAESAPRIGLEATRSDDGSWTLELQLERFRMTPMRGADAEPSAEQGGEPEGHAHLYVNGELEEMIFSTPHKIARLSPGTHTLMVQLSTPDHRTFTVDGTPVRAELTVRQP